MTQDIDWAQGVDWSAIREHRLARIVEELRASGLDAVMYTTLDALRYIASFRGVTSLWFQGNRYVIFVTADGHVKFLIASGDMDRVRATMPWLSDYEAFPFLARAGVPVAENAIRELGLGSAKIGTDMLTFGFYVPLKKRLPKAAFVDGRRVIEEARRVKHPEEIKVIREAAEVTDIGMMTALETISPGVTEQQVSAAAAYQMTLAGSEDIPYLPLVVSGENMWMHYRFPTDRRIRPGDMVWIDTGACIINGYNGDMGRTTVLGQPTQAQKDIYRCIYDMLEAGTDLLRVGVETPKVAKAINDVAKERGWGDHVYYGICGHGIGTDLHEAPDIGELVAGGSEPAMLMENEVICLEPGITLPGLGGGHLEDMVLITEDGPERLTKTPFEDSLL